MTKERNKDQQNTTQKNVVFLLVFKALYYISVHIKHMYVIVDRNFINSTLYQIV